MYASFLGISEAPVPRAGSMTERDFAKLNLHMDIFHQPLRNRFFDSLSGRSPPSCDAYLNLKKGSILALSNCRARTLDGLSGVLGRRQKPCLLYRVSSRDSPLRRPRTQAAQIESKPSSMLTEQSNQSYLLCAPYLKATGKFFGSSRECRLAHGLFKRLEY
jgi:hypothetical protein